MIAESPDEREEGRSNAALTFSAPRLDLNMQSSFRFISLNFEFKAQDDFKLIFGFAQITSLWLLNLTPRLEEAILASSQHTN